MESLRRERDGRLSGLWFQARENRIQVYFNQGEAEKAGGALAGLAARRERGRRLQSCPEYRILVR
jgi:hypothetical protein